MQGEATDCRIIGKGSHGPTTSSSIGSIAGAIFRGWSGKRRFCSSATTQKRIGAHASPLIPHLKIRAVALRGAARKGRKSGLLVLWPDEDRI